MLAVGPLCVSIRQFIRSHPCPPFLCQLRCAARTSISHGGRGCALQGSDGNGGWHTHRFTCEFSDFVSAAAPRSRGASAVILHALGRKRVRELRSLVVSHSSPATDQFATRGLDHSLPYVFVWFAADHAAGYVCPRGWMGRQCEWPLEYAPGSNGGALLFQSGLPHQRPMLHTVTAPFEVALWHLSLHGASAGAGFPSPPIYLNTCLECNCSFDFCCHLALRTLEPGETLFFEIDVKKATHPNSRNGCA